MLSSLYLIVIDPINLLEFLKIVILSNNEKKNIISAYYEIILIKVPIESNSTILSEIYSLLYYLFDNNNIIISPNNDIIDLYLKFKNKFNHNIAKNEIISWINAINTDTVNKIIINEILNIEIIITNDYNIIINDKSNGFIEYSIIEINNYYNKKINKLEYNNIAFGGSFDGLHCGHLQFCFECIKNLKKDINDENIINIGIMPDEALNKNDNDRSLFSYKYNTRVKIIRNTLQCFIEFSSLNNIKYKIEIHKLDLKGLGFAELEPAVKALIVSEETLIGGKKINELRLRNNLALLKLIIIPLVFDIKENIKVSSTIAYNKLNKFLIDKILVYNKDISITNNSINKDYIEKIKKNLAKLNLSNEILRSFIYRYYNMILNNKIVFNKIKKEEIDELLSKILTLDNIT